MDSPRRDGERKPALQALMDNPWVLLVLGVLIPFLSYSVWGWYEVASMAPATLP